MRKPELPGRVLARHHLDSHRIGDDVAVASKPFGSI